MRPSVQQPISKDKNVMARPRKYYLKNNYLTLRSKVITVRDTPPYGHAPTYQISLTYLERQKCYGPDKKILLKKTIIWPWGQRSRSHEGHCGMRHTTLWSCTHIPNKYYLKNNYLTLMSKVKVSQRSLWYAIHRLMIMHPHTKYHWPISKDKNVMAQTRKYYWKNNYLTLRSKVKVPQRSLRYATYRLMVMHSHTKYNWPISKDKNVMVWTRKYYLKNNYLTWRSKVKVPQRSLQYATHRLMVMHPHTK
jgi:hypothetical protein